MGSQPPLVRAAAPAPWTLRVDGDGRIPAATSETVTTALLCAGIVATSRSVKFRRPRGPYCLTGDCGTCLVRLGGRPNIRACLTPTAEHLAVESQNVTKGPDPSALADRVFGKGMDHHHFMVKPRVLNEVMKGIARNLAGLGTLPDKTAGHPASHRHHAPDVLIIGGGPAGYAVRTTLRAARVNVQLIERFPALGSTVAEGVLMGAGVFGVYGAEGLVAAAATDLAKGDTLHTFAPQHLVFATGARDTLLPLVNNDLPGVVSARGLLRQLRAGTARPGSCIVVGQGPHAASIAAALGSRHIETNDVVEIVGDDAVEGIQTKSERLACSLVALAPRPSPASDLARQDGAAVAWDGAGFALRPDPTGKLETHGPWASWACGDVCGFMGEDEAELDGRRVGDRIADVLSGGTP